MSIYELFKSTDVVIPLGQALLYISLITIFMLLGKPKLAMVTTYFFALYWVYVLNSNYFISKAGGVEYAPFIYGFGGFVLIVLTLFSFFFQEY